MPPANNTSGRQRLIIWSGHLAALLAGALPTLSLAPFGWWPLGIVAVAILMALLDGQRTATVAWRSWLFGVGLFGSGTSWVYVSIQQFGHAPVWLAGLLVLLFTAMLALFLLLVCLPYHLIRRPNPTAAGLLFAACWTLGEWLRCWFMTGFPWLFLGHAHVATPLSGWAPITGVLGLSFVVALTGAALHKLLTIRGRRRFTLGWIAASLWLGGGLLQSLDWVEPAGEPVKVALIQPNIPQAIKWQAAAFDHILNIYQDLSDGQWDADLLVWPEAAIPRLYQSIPSIIRELDTRAERSATTLITGLPYGIKQKNSRQVIYYNSVAALGLGQGLYFKQRLVPFGEYVPLEHWLRGLIEFFNLPMSHMSWGPAKQEPLLAGQWRLAPFICYEVVYPGLVATDTANAEFIINISNDSWFGRSIGPLQHFQNARMRALENGRYLIRGTNNGITAIVDHRGRVTTSTPQFTRTVVRGEATPMRGRTLFNRLGHLPIVLICVLILVTGAVWQRSHGRNRPVM